MKAIVVQLGSSMFLAILTSMSSFANVWPSYAIPMLKSDESPLGYKITEHEANIISSIPMLGSVMSTLLTGYVSEAIGRKKTQILCALIYLVSWSLIVTARSTIQTIVGRFITGLSSGMALVSVLVYSGEISELSNRGSCTTMVGLLYNTGMLVSYFEGWFLSYDMIAYVCLISAALFVILMSFMKETPPYLMRKGREKEALSALKFYRGVSETTEVVLEELANLKSQVNSGNVPSADIEKPMLEKEISQKENEDDLRKKKSPWVLLVTVAYNRRALITLAMFMVLTILMGMVAVQTYANQFFAKAAPTMSSDLCSVLFAVVLIFTSSLTMVVTDLVSRRTLMISTCVIATACVATLGSVLRWSWAPSWVATLVTIIFSISFHMGVVNIVFIQITESFEPHVNSAAASVILCFMFGSNFVVIFCFGPSVEYFGIDGTFFIFAFLGVVTTVMAIFFLKETRLVPIEDVQKMYSKGFLCTRL